MTIADAHPSSSARTSVSAIMTVWGQWTNTGVSLIDPFGLITANLNKRMQFPYNRYEFENVVCKMTARLSWSQ